MSDEIERNSKGQFMPGSKAWTKRTGKKRNITSLMLDQFVRCEKRGDVTPFVFWMDLINNRWPGMESMSYRYRINAQLDAAKNLAKYIYDASYDTEEAEKMGLTAEKVEALKAAFPEFAKKD